MESEEGDMSQPVPDNGRDWTWGWDTAWYTGTPVSEGPEYLEEIRKKTSQHPSWEDETETEAGAEE